MKLGMVGLGRMGGNMTERLRRDGHEVQTYDRSGSGTAQSLAELVDQLEAPRAVWVMVPAGDPTEETVQELVERLDEGDVIVDGGNSNWNDGKRRAEVAGKKGIHFLDVGVSGGIWGLKEGYCLMAGGADEGVEVMRPAFETLAPQDGWAHVGPAGAGHYVKMIHNGIEYGLMQAYAEGFELMHHSEYEIDLAAVSGIWRYGSVVRSWLLDLLHESFAEHGSDLGDIGSYVEDSGEGRWTITEAIDRAVPAPVISAALFARFASRDDVNFAAKVAAALRNQFGGHAVRAVEKAESHPEQV